MKIRQAVILAGGLGTRLLPQTKKIPKPMIRFYGKPFLAYLLEMLKKNGIEEVILLLGYLPQKIISYCGKGEKFGLKIKYSIGSQDWDTGKRLVQAENLLQKHFLLMYCDNYWPLDLRQLVNFYQNKKALASVVIYSNKNNITKNNTLVDENGLVLLYDKLRTTKNLNGVELGFFILDKKILEMMPKTNFHFESFVFSKLVERKELWGFLTDHRYYSIGKPESLSQTKKFLKPKKAIFLDRDGVINLKMPKGDYVKKWSEFKFLPGAKRALKLLTQAKFDIFIVTNQAGVGRGLMTEKDLQVIHQKMKQKLTSLGVKIKKIYYCPHGWDDNCQCRKPKPGILFQAAFEYCFDLTKAIFIGDKQSDFIAGQNAGCKTYLVTSKKNLLKIIKDKNFEAIK